MACVRWRTGTAASDAVCFPRQEAGGVGAAELAAMPRNERQELNRKGGTMTGGANKSFTTNPANFLQNNVLLVDIQSLVNTDAATEDSIARNAAKHNAGGLITVNIVKDTANSGKKNNGSKTVAYKVTEASGAASKYSHRFSAYYLPFFNNDYRTMRLGANADYFFTDTMNGCSFASGPGAPPKVGHFNRTSGENDMIDQNAIDHDIEGEFGGGTHKELKKATYKTGVGHKASLIGIRNNAGWDFYYQAYEIDGATGNGYVYKIEANMPTKL